MLDAGRKGWVARLGLGAVVLGFVGSAVLAVDVKQDRSDRFTSDEPVAPVDPAEVLTVAEVWPPLKLPARIEEMDAQAMADLSAVIKPDQGEIFDDLRAGRYSVLVHLDPGALYGRGHRRRRVIASRGK